MGSINAAEWDIMASGPADDGFEDLRDAFRARLARERMHFTTASAALAAVGGDPASVYNDLQERARRLHGGAMIFEFGEVAAAASTLEHAALLASTSHCDNTDGAVWAALIFLVELMGRQQGKRIRAAADGVTSRSI